MPDYKPKMIIYLLIIMLTKHYTQYRNLQLFGDSEIGYYYVNVLIGTPPQKQSLILDSGSKLTILPCKGCTNCNKHQNPLYTPENSSTFKKVTKEDKINNWKCPIINNFQNCSFNQGYLEGSDYSGYYAQDVFLFENESIENYKDYRHVFGCANSETGEFYNQEADGIIGIGIGKGDNKAPGIIETEVSQNRLITDVFSICIAQSGGMMTFGNWNKDKHLKKNEKSYINTTNMEWDNQYKVPLTNIKVDDLDVDYTFEELNKDGGSAFFDTGTTFVYFDFRLFGKIKQQINHYCSQSKERCAGYDKFQDCYNIDFEIFKDKFEMARTFPSLNFDFDGAEYKWLPQDQFVDPLDTSDSSICYGMKSLTNVILGAVFMRNYDVYFDRTNKRIAFSRSNCGNLKNYFDIYPEDDVNYNKISIPNKSLNKNKDKKITIKENSNKIKILQNDHEIEIKDGKNFDNFRYIIIAFTFTLLITFIFVYILIKKKK